jgi:tetratricopeptide (TPR) repeat protein
MLSHFFKQGMKLVSKTSLLKSFTFKTIQQSTSLYKYSKYNFANISRTQLDMMLDDFFRISDAGDLKSALQKGLHIMEQISNNSEYVREYYDLVINLAQLYSKHEQYKKGLELLEEFYNKIEKLFIDPEARDEALVNIRDKLAFMNGQLNNYEKSENLLKENIEFLTKSLARDTTNFKQNKLMFAYTYYNLFNLQTFKNDPEELRKATLEKAYEIYSEYQNELQSIGYNINKELANLCFLAEDYEDALKYFKNASIIKRESAEEDDAEMYDIITGLGNCYEAVGEYEKAISEFKKALEMKAKAIQAMKKDDPYLREHYADLAKLHEFIGEIYVDTDELPPALEYINEAKTILAKFQSPEIEYARIYYLLATIFFKKKFFDKCIENSKRYIKAIDSTNEENHSVTGWNKEIIELNKFKCFKMIAECYFNLKEHEKCKKYVLISLNLLDIVKQLDTDETFIEKYEVAKLNSFIGNYEEAIAAYKSVLDTIAENKTKNMEDEEVDSRLVRFDSLFNIGILKIEQLKYEEAKEMLSELLGEIVATKLSVLDDMKEEINKKIALINMKLKYNK